VQIEQTVFGEVLVLSLFDARIDGRVGTELKQTIADIINRGHRRVVIDLTAVAYIDSTGLGAIVASLKMIGRQGELVLCGLSDSATTLFKLTRMDKVFRSFTTAADAVQALAVSALAAGAER
jgi:anti-sigma B factor antagonist